MSKVFKKFKRVWSVGFAITTLTTVLIIPFYKLCPVWVGQVIAGCNLVWWTIGICGLTINECWKDE